MCLIYILFCKTPFTQLAAIEAHAAWLFCIISDKKHLGVLYIPKS